VHDFLIGGGLKSAGGFFVTHLTGNFGEVTVLNMRHRLAGKGGLQIGHGFDLGALGCGHGELLVFKNLLKENFYRHGLNHRGNLLIRPIGFG
jgi:hypothetical protein